MPKHAITRVSHAAWSRRTAVPLALLIMLLGVSLASAQVVAQYDFETGVQGWSGFNGATLTTSTVASQAGNQSILATTNSGGASSGPSLNATSLLLPGAKYTITGWVMLTSGETATNANFTIMRSDPSCTGGTCFDTVGTYQVPVTNSGWAQIGGAYTVSQTATALTLYAQLVGPTTTQTFYFDSVVITQTAPPPGGTPVASYNFSDGGLDGWAPFGSVTLTNTISPLADPAGNAHSLLTSGRTATYMGPSLNLLSVNGVVAGATYAVSAYVLLAAPDSSNPTVTLSTKRADCGNTSGAFSNLATSAALSSTAWTKVQGNLTFNNLPGPPTELTLYFQSSSATDSFYISNVVIGEVAPPPLPADQQDNTGITSTFEDGGLDGWGGRAGATVSNVSGISHSGSNSLLTTGRTANYDGPKIDVSNKMYNGSQYAISVWVRMQPTDGTTHIINMSLQTTLNGTTNFPGVNGYPGASIPADGNWHQISVPNFNMSNAYDPGTASLYLQTFPSSGTDLVSFYIDDFQLTYIPPPSIQTDIPSIFERLEDFFPVGAAVNPTDISGPHAQLLTKHFNSLVSGNDMKWSSVENTKGAFNYSNADAQVGLAQCNNMKVRGHNLVWANGGQTPSYAFGDGTNSPANQAVVTANIQEHIQNEVTHFGDKVYAWDVVNEPFDENQPDCLVHGPFYNVLGKSYIDIALQTARQYAPNAKLFLNDFNTSIPAKLACVVKVVQDLQARGIPIDAVGHEMHNSINFPSVSSMETAIKTVAKLGVDQQVTELDLSVYNGGDNTSNYGANGGTVPPSIIAQQGYLYWQYFRLFRRMHRHLSGVTIWGMADDDTWLSSFPIARLNLPLPFDTNLQAKPAYWGIINEPGQLPGFHLHFDITSKTGPRKARVWTITAHNGGPGTAYTVQINGLTLQQLFGQFEKHNQCSPVITPSTFPVSLGDIPEDGTASASFTIDFSGCRLFSGPFTVDMPWSQANGADTGHLRALPQLP